MCSDPTTRSCACTPESGTPDAQNSWFPKMISHGPLCLMLTNPALRRYLSRAVDAHHRHGHAESHQTGTLQSGADGIQIPGGRIKTTGRRLPVSASTAFSRERTALKRGADGTRGADGIPWSGKWDSGDRADGFKSRRGRHPVTARMASRSGADGTPPLTQADSVISGSRAAYGPTRHRHGLPAQRQATGADGHQSPGRRHPITGRRIQVRARTARLRRRTAASANAPNAFRVADGRRSRKPTAYRMPVPTDRGRGSGASETLGSERRSRTRRHLTG